MKQLMNVKMSNYTTYKTGGIVDTMYFPSTINELSSLILNLKEEKVKYYLIGNGSNLIVPDTFFSGAIINLKNLNNYQLKDNILYLEAGVMLPVVANKMVDLGYQGLEWASGIPGTIGGSIYNNAGAYNGAIADILESVTVLDENNQLITLSNEECLFSYRDSIFKQTKKYTILSCTLKLTKGDSLELKELVNDRFRRRKESQPLEYPSAGSVFRNPEPLKAGKIIEDLGLKGYQIGDAKVSEKHANFIVNNGNATSTDIINIINYINESVEQEYGFKLVLEQEIIEW